MSRQGAHIRSLEGINAAIEECTADLENLGKDMLLNNDIY